MMKIATASPEANSLTKIATADDMLKVIETKAPLFLKTPLWFFKITDEDSKDSVLLWMDQGALYANLKEQVI